MANWKDAKAHKHELDQTTGRDTHTAKTAAQNHTHAYTLGLTTPAGLNAAFTTTPPGSQDSPAVGRIRDDGTLLISLEEGTEITPELVRAIQELMNAHAP